ncbi:MAG: hypothetical protein RL173_3672 [Fibrobacterota bacterium]|jgi:hypothetical protein
MRWLAISAVSSAVGYAGWKMGNAWFSSTAGLWLSFFAGIAGLYAGLVVFPKNS